MASGFPLDTLGDHKHTFHFDSDHELSYRRDIFIAANVGTFYTFTQFHH